MRHLPVPRQRLSGVVSGRLARILAAILLFNMGIAAWSAVVAGRLAQGGAPSADLGTLYAICELVRLPAILLLPVLMLRCGARRITQTGLLVLSLLPLAGLGGLNETRSSLVLALAAIPSVMVYAGLPAFLMGATAPGREGWAMASLALTGGAGGALGPWVGGWLSDTRGPVPVLVLLGASSVVLLVAATRGPLPPPTPWSGWRILVGRGAPWLALGALAFASAADAGRAVLVPAALVRNGLSLADVGMLLGLGCAVAGAGFFAFGRLADRHAPSRVIGIGLVVLAVGSITAIFASAWSPAFAVSAAVLGMGASGTRLGAEVALVMWIGRDRAALAAAVGETTILGGRALGAPAVGALGDAGGLDQAFGAIALAGLATAALIPLAAWFRLPHRTHRPGTPSAA